MTAPHVVVAFDAFKGSLTAVEACAAAARGVHAVLPDARVTQAPMADGGEGSLDALLARGGVEHRTPTVDAIGRPTVARWAMHEAQAIIELAQAAGLPLVEDVPLQPRDASTVGLGRVVLDALEHGATDVTLLLGGSATTDGGAGVLTALGVRLLDAAGAPVQPGGGGLATLDRVDLERLDPRVRTTRWRFVTDVDAPLTGARGAAAVFGPQKGADAADVNELDAALARLAERAATALGVEASAITDVPGAGAAGGVASVLRVLTDGAVVAGSDWFAELADLDGVVADADFVLTGEGRFDEQSAGGKVVSAVHRVAQAHSVPWCVLAGSVDPAAAAAMDVPAWSLAIGPASLETLQRDAAVLLEAAATSATRLRFAPVAR